MAQRRYIHTKSALSDLAADLNAVDGVLALSLAQNELVIDVVAVLANELARSEELRTEGTNFSGLRRHGCVRRTGKGEFGLSKGTMPQSG